MTTLLTEYWPLLVTGALVALVLLYLLLRPRQRVTLTDSAPVRPHMAVTPPATGIAATTAVAAEAILSPRPTETLIPAGAKADDLTALKGVGPKLAALLNSHGIVRFDQIASLSPSQIDDLDDQLGAFRGRLKRDHVVDQADYLTRGDVDGFEQRFGKL